MEISLAVLKGSVCPSIGLNFGFTRAIVHSTVLITSVFGCKISVLIFDFWKEIPVEQRYYIRIKNTERNRPDARGLMGSQRYYIRIKHRTRCLPCMVDHRLGGLVIIGHRLLCAVASLRYHWCVVVRGGEVGRSLRRADNTDVCS